MATFRDLNEFFVDHLELVIDGKTYTIPAADAETGLFCQRLMTAGLAAANGAEPNAEDVELLNDEQEKDMFRRVLGPVYDELIADGVSWPKLKHVGLTAFWWTAGNKETALQAWESGAEGEAPAPNRATRRVEAAVARSTRTRGSASGTSRATASRSKKAKEAKSPGTTS